MTKEEIKQFSNIPTSEIKQDIIDTQNEINQYETELQILRKNPIENRMEIYIRKGRILNRKEFLKTLNEILEPRKIKEKVVLK